MYRGQHHYLFYKPFQTLSQFSPSEDKKTLADYLHSLPKNVYPVGRLDYDSEGLLFLTDDKSLNHKLLHPASHHEKEYWAQIEGIPAEHDLARLSGGLLLTAKGRSFLTKPAQAKLIEAPKIAERNPPIRFRKQIPTSWISVVLTEGKNRQVRKMTAAIGFPTLRLIRCRIGKMTLDDMKPGDIRQLNNEQVAGLLAT